VQGLLPILQQYGIESNPKVQMIKISFFLKIF